ncbi:MAG: hypothetical protein ACLT8E_06585 [Akkermansia sp.]
MLDWFYEDMELPCAWVINTTADLRHGGLPPALFACVAAAFSRRPRT